MFSALIQPGTYTEPTEHTESELVFCFSAFAARENGVVLKSQMRPAVEAYAGNPSVWDLGAEGLGIQSYPRLAPSREKKKALRSESKSAKEQGRVGAVRRGYKKA